MESGEHPRQLTHVSELYAVLQKKLQDDLITCTEQSGRALISAWDAYSHMRSQLPGWPREKKRSKRGLRRSE